MLFLRFGIWILSLFVLDFLIGKLGIYDKAPTLVAPLGLLVVCAEYLALLFWGVALIKRVDGGISRAKKDSFWFSFLIGVTWGILASSIEGVPHAKNLSILEIIITILGYFLCGIFVGALGWVLGSIFWQCLNLSEGTD